MFWSNRQITTFFINIIFIYSLIYDLSIPQEALQLILYITFFLESCGKTFFWALMIPSNLFKLKKDNLTLKFLIMFLNLYKYPIKKV